MEKILLAADGSESCNKAIKFALEFTQNIKTNITVFTVVEEGISFQVGGSREQIAKKTSKQKEIQNKAQKITQDCANELEKTSNKVNIRTKTGNPARLICEEAKKGNYDLVIIADKGGGSGTRFLLGGTAEKVIRYCDTSVLVAK